MSKISPVVITEPSVVKALKLIYEASGPGGLDWDFSVPGQVTVQDGRLKIRDGVLIGLNLEWINLSDLSPLAGLTGLQELDLSGNEINDLKPLAGLTELQDLNLEWNLISNIVHLGGLTKLNWLNLDWNQINDFAPLGESMGLAYHGNHELEIVTEPSAMRALKLIYEANGPDNLEWDFSIVGQVRGKDGRLKARDGALLGLNLSGKIIKNLSPLAGLPNLKKLNLRGNVFRGNKIDDLRSLAGLTELVSLDLGYNEISDLSPLAGMTKLVLLDLEDNCISDLSPLASLTKLAFLNLDSNCFSDIAPLAGMTELTDLNLGEHNEITHEPLIRTALAPLANLTKLTYMNWFGMLADEIGESTDGFEIGECEGMRVCMYLKAKPPAHVSFATSEGDCYYSIFGEFLKGVELPQDIDWKVRNWLKVNEKDLATRWGRCLIEGYPDKL